MVINENWIFNTNYPLLWILSKVYKRWYQIPKNKEFINDNLEIGCHIVTQSGIIGEVTNIEGEIITILSGDNESINKLKIQKSEIKNIIS